MNKLLQSAVVVLSMMAMMPYAGLAQIENILWYKAPASEWTEALPVGNGRLGAMVFGGVGRERIQLNEESLWGGSKLDNNNPESLTYLPVIREAIFKGEYEWARVLAERHMLGIPPRIRSYQTLGDLQIAYDWKSEPEAYRRELRLNEGVARTFYTVNNHAFSQEVYASAPHNALVVELKSEGTFTADFRLNRQRDVDRYQSGQGVAWFEGQVRDEDSPLAGPGGLHMRFATVMRVLHTDGRVDAYAGADSAGIMVSSAKSVVLVLTAATDYNFDKLDTDPALHPLTICNGILERVSGVRPEQIRATHEKDHRGMFERVAFRLGMGDEESTSTDERIAAVKSGASDVGLVALYFQYARYLLMASSRAPGKLPANLQGIWNDLFEAKWNSDFHTNINLQMNYWLAEVANLPETSEPLAAFLSRLMVPGAQTARTLYGADGWTLHHLTDVYGRTGVADGVWGLSPMAGPWTTFPVFRHYEFTHDRRYLEHTAYPVMRGSVLFVLDFLVESPEGYLVTNPSHSPENPFYIPGANPKEKTYLCYAATIDTQIVRGLFSNFIKAAAVLNRDAELVSRLKVALDRLPPMEVGANGTLMEWIRDYEEVEPGHRHISHLLGLYPLSLINPDTPHLFEAAKRTIERRMKYSTWHVGWSFAWIINFYARLYDGEKAGEQVERLFRISTLGNLFNTIPPFQIDGNMGGAAGIAEMLLQSHNGELHLLPALPASWSDGNIAGLKARGNYTVDFAWSAGKLTSLAVESPANGAARIRYGGTTRAMKLKKGRNVIPVQALK